MSQAKLQKDEKTRLYELQSYERELRLEGYKQIAGIDEAGRGPLAGPVVAAACIIPEWVLIPGIDDSKKLTPKQRKSVFDNLTCHSEVFYGVGIVSHEEIDRLNILQASILAMHHAILTLKQKPDYLLVDGLGFPGFHIPNKKIIQGDSKSYAIGAASIIAKETRDKIMDEYHEKWPEYGFNTHKGYGTEKHRTAIEKYGPCPIHRMTFEPLKSFWSAKALPSLSRGL